MKEQNVLKIGEFARLAQVSLATLRHYEKSGLFKPVALDPDTGYRYYTLDQLPRLNRILALKDLGFSLEQIARILEEELPLEQLRGMLTLKQAQTQQMIDAEQERLTHIAARLRQIEQEGKMPDYEILLKQVEPLLVASIRSRVPAISEWEQLHETLSSYLQEQGVHASQAGLLLLHSRHEQHGESVTIDIEVAVPLPVAPPGNEQIQIRTLPGALMASAVHTGGDLLLGRAHMALHHWMEESGYRLVGPPRLLHLQRAGDINPGATVTEMQFPVGKQ